MDNDNKEKTTVSFKNGIHVHEGGRDVDVSLRRGVQVHSENESIDVSLNGVHIENDKDSVHLNKDEMWETAKAQGRLHKSEIILRAIMVAVAGACYVLIGMHYGAEGWKYGWMIFLIASVIASVFVAIKKKNPTEFEYAVLATVVFLLLGFFKGCWHPAWIIFLTIPVYYTICDKIQKPKEK